MDRMQPPPNYYGAPYNGFNTPNQPMGPQTMNPQMPLNMPSPNMNNSSMPPQPNSESPSSDYYPSGNVYTELNNNRGKRVRVYCSFTDSSKWHDMVFEGTLVYALSDNICIKPQNEELYQVIVGVYVIFVEFLDKPVIPPLPSN